MEILTHSQQMIRIAFEGRTQGILFWVSIYVFVAGLYSLWFQIRTRNWPSAKGKLTQVQVKKFGGNRMCNHRSGLYWQSAVHISGIWKTVRGVQNITLGLFGKS
jgi:hypothetical protein